MCLQGGLLTKYPTNGPLPIDEDLRTLVEKRLHGFGHKVVTKRGKERKKRKPLLQSLENN